MKARRIAEDTEARRIASEEEQERIETDAAAESRQATQEAQAEQERAVQTLEAEHKHSAQASEIVQSSVEQDERRVLDIEETVANGESKDVERSEVEEAAVDEPPNVDLRLDECVSQRMCNSSSPLSPSRSYKLPSFSIFSAACLRC